MFPWGGEGMKEPQVCASAKSKYQTNVGKNYNFFTKTIQFFSPTRIPRLRFLYTHRCRQQHTRFISPCRHPKAVTIPDTSLGLRESCPTLKPLFDPIPPCQAGPVAPLGWHSHPVWEQWGQRCRGEGTVLGALAAARLQMHFKKLLRAGIFCFFIIWRF